MNGKLLIEILDDFNKSQWSELNSFISSNTSKGSDMLILLSKLESQGRRKTIDTEIIRINHFKHMRLKSFQNLLSKLYSVTLDFLSWKQFKSDPYINDIYKLKYLNRHGYYKQADKLTAQLDKKYSADEYIDGKGLWAKQQIRYYEYFSDNPHKYKKNENLLKDLMHQTTLNHCCELLLLSTEMSNWSRIRKFDYETQINSLRKTIATLPIDNNTKLYTDIHDLVVNDSLPAGMRILVNLENQDIKRGSDLEVVASLYMVEKMLILFNKNTLKDIQVIYKVFDVCLKNGALMKDGRIPERRFNKIISILSHKSREQEVINFIDKWSDKVNAPDQQATADLAMSLYYFYTKQFDRILGLVNNIGKLTIGQKMNMNTIKSITLFELGNEMEDTLYYHLENTERMIRRNKDHVLKVFYKAHQNMNQIIKLMLKSKYKKRHIALSDYKEIMFKDWFKEKLGE